jgi:hypothetical protein
MNGKLTEVQRVAGKESFVNLAFAAEPDLQNFN